MDRLRPSLASIGLFLVLAGAGSAACLALLSVRMQRSGSPEFSFLEWNLVLAWLPLGFALVALALYRLGLPARVWGWALLPWLLFLPNAPYLVTDLVHVGNTWADVPVWFDFLMIGTFGATGLLLGYASLYLVQHILIERFGRIAGWGMTIGSLALSSVGIYLGRVLRLNSWDAVLRPGLFIEKLQDRFSDPLANPAALTLLAAMALLLAAGYLAFLASTLAIAHRPSASGRKAAGPRQGNR
ncbi:MAG: DUF1361 domain-containing protein [Chloroflexi bacterium]|nr:DUF1361 domain-containing protein [Chloroflexota bacterium]